MKRAMVINLKHTPKYDGKKECLNQRLDVLNENGNKIMLDTYDLLGYNAVFHISELETY